MQEKQVCCETKEFVLLRDSFLIIILENGNICVTLQTRSVD